MRRAEEIRDIVDNKLSAASRKRLKAALSNGRDWFFQNKTMGLTQSTTRDFDLTDGTVFKRMQRLLGGGGNNGNCCSRCFGGVVRTFCTASSWRSIFKGAWRGVRDEHEIIAIFLSNPATARMSQSTYVVLLGLMIQTMILVEASFWRLRYASDNKISSDNFDLINYLLAMVVASVVSTILATIVKTIVIKRGMFQKSRRVLELESVATIKPRIILSGEFYVRWKKKKVEVAASRGSKHTRASFFKRPVKNGLKTTMAAKQAGNHWKSKLQRSQSAPDPAALKTPKRKKSAFMRALTFRTKSKPGDGENRTSSAPAAAVVHVSQAEVRQRPWLEGFTTEEADACKPQVVRIYCVGERYAFVSFDKLPEKGGRATGRFVIDGYSKVSQQYLSTAESPGAEPSAATDGKESETKGELEEDLGESKTGDSAGKVWQLILQGGDKTCELYSPDDIDHHAANSGAECEWAHKSGSVVVASHVWYAAILQLIKEEHNVDHETVKHRVALDEERTFVATLMISPPIDDRFYFALNSFFAFVCCRGCTVRCGCCPKKEKRRRRRRRQGASAAKPTTAVFTEEEEKKKKMVKPPRKKEEEKKITRTAAHRACILACFREESDNLLHMNRHQNHSRFENQQNYDKETVQAIVDFDTQFDDEHTFGVEEKGKSVPRRSRKGSIFGSLKRSKSQSGAGKRGTPAPLAADLGVVEEVKASNDDATEEKGQASPRRVGAAAASSDDAKEEKGQASPRRGGDNAKEEKSQTAPKRVGDGRIVKASSGKGHDARLRRQHFSTKTKSGHKKNDAKKKRRNAKSPQLGSRRGLGVLLGGVHAKISKELKDDQVRRVYIYACTMVPLCVPAVLCVVNHKLYVYLTVYLSASLVSSL